MRRAPAQFDGSRATADPDNAAAVISDHAAMLKRIPASDLRLGMHVEELCGSWMEHPFWRTRFKLTDLQDIERIRASGIAEVWIDTSKGLDVARDDGAEITRERVDGEIERALARAIAQPQSAPARAPIDEEMARAARICRQAKPAVVAMFNEARMGRAIDAAGAASLVQEISDSVSRNPGALISIARLKDKDEYTYMHSVAVCALMIALARQLGLDDDLTRELGLAGLLHDIGKAKVPLEILNKPGKLTDAEFEAVKSHPKHGHAILAAGGAAGAIALDVCLHHHEKIDGSGYPHRLKGEAISLYAKMGAVCDVYDAITSNRPYKSGWNPAESIRRMAEWTSGHFDEAVFRAFVKTVGIYPVGSLVRMESGRLGIVVEQTEGALLTPKVKLFFSTKSQLHIPPETIDLSRPATGDRIASREDPERWGLTHVDELWAGEAAARRA
ncbi:MAG: cyclic di-GMP phosphodiesterase [Betaproteobacteria bacterium]|nr:MAG: cyclic di-GMP phosphodiesterase [Betaproteobacteria bacterium]